MLMETAINRKALSGIWSTDQVAMPFRKAQEHRFPICDSQALLARLSLTLAHKQL